MRWIYRLRDILIRGEVKNENFLSGNALNFLGLYRGNKNYKRLEQFYRDNSIEQPQWFKSI
jgi:hypothetical protein